MFYSAVWFVVASAASPAGKETSAHEAAVRGSGPEGAHRPKRAGREPGSGAMPHARTA